MRMRNKLAVILPLGALTAAIVISPAAARSMRRDFGGFGISFQMHGRPLGGTKPAKATAAYLAGNRIAAVGDGALVLDSDSGELIKTDKNGSKAASVPIGKNAGLLAYDPVGKLAYVADRTGNRVAVVKVSDSKLEVSASYKTPVEPYGVALSPDRKTLLVTTIADRALVALEAASGKEQWRTGLGREPRNIAVSPDGKRAVVAYLTTGTVDQVDLIETKKAEHIALSTQNGQRRFRPTGSGDAFARGAFTALFMGDQQALVPFQRETPVQAIGGGERTGSYGGGFEAPITSQLAFLATSGERTSQITAQIGQHQARSLAWDSERDALYVVGLGSDSIIQLKNASQVTIAEGASAALVATNGKDGKERCGPDGVAIAPDGDVLVWCSFSRSVKRLETVDDSGKLQASINITKTTNGPTLVVSSFTDKQHEGMELFHISSTQISAGGALACASCHPDGRADGLSWRIDKQELQTPVLVGRVANTHPYKWDGGDPDINASLTGTMKRLGGTGLKPEQTEALTAYLEALPGPQTPTRDARMVERGAKLFDSAELGCRSCHDGAQYTDNTKHEFKTATLPMADTPSLIGLAAGAPYYHDGSAATLEALLRDRGRVHGMAETAKLDDKQVADLIAFLETL
jgi:DNA-binding beta-propeller fold protein YncE/mono/diheme cytochrome c family protein